MSGTGIAEALEMADRSLEERVAALEEKVGEKSIAEQFAEQGRLIDQAFAYHFALHDRKWDAKLRRELEKSQTRAEKRLEAKLEETEKRLEVKLEKTLGATLDPIRAQLSDLSRDVKAILGRLS